MEYGYIDITYRSRLTLLNMLQASGYDTTPYRRMSPKEIEMMIGPSALGGALRMDLTRPVQNEEMKSKCVVLYSFQKLKQKLDGFLNELISEETAENLRIDPETTEVIVMLYEPVMEVFHAKALNYLKKHNLMIRFFEAKRIVNDPTSFAIVPKHEKIGEEDVKKMMNECYLQSKAQLPILRFHEDMQARWLGLVPGDVVKITRSSPSAGEYTLYRVCAP